MSVSRQQLLEHTKQFRNKKYMQTQYGITITEEQIQAADRLIERYQRMTSQELRALDESLLQKWPYQITESQKYERIMHNVPLSMTQSVLWKTIRKYLSEHPEEAKRDGAIIAQALQDIEGLLQLNAYMGEFEENKSLIDGKDTSYLMKLFTLSYNKYLNNRV